MIPSTLPPKKKYVHILFTETYEWDLIWKKNLKDIEMRRLHWIIQVGPKSSDKCLYKRHTEETHGREKQCDYGGRDWNNVVTSPSMLTARGSITDFRLLASRNVKRVNFCFAKCVVIC